MCTLQRNCPVTYFVHKGSDLYSLVVDATKAFDRVNYCKLFRILLRKNVCPFICRLLINMYINQKLRVKWGDTFSEYFTVSNGVKQGGVISPMLYCLYIDDLIEELKASNVGCYMGAVYAGIDLYDLTLLAPSVQALRIMLAICLNYASRFDIKSNDKSQLIIFRSKMNHFICPKITINGVELKPVHHIIHLGHVIHDDIFKSDASKCISDFNTQCNIFFADFKNSSSFIRNHLFLKYCTSFYGVQFLPIYDRKLMKDLYVAWRMAVRRVWKVPWTTHSNLLPHLAGVMPPELAFAKRTISFIRLLLNSNNKVVRTITGMGICGSH